MNTYRLALTDKQRATLMAALDRILPADRGAGATKAHAIRYVEWLIQQPRFQPLSDCLASGLEFLESLADAICGESFPACLPHEQDTILERLQDTPHPTMQRFFQMLVRMALAGFLCAPEYGGNRGRIGWSYIGFTPHPVTLGSLDARVEQ